MRYTYGSNRNPTTTSCRCNLTRHLSLSDRRNRGVVAVCGMAAAEGVEPTTASRVRPRNETQRQG